jgi:predicted aspartyl protease
MKTLSSIAAIALGFVMLAALQVSNSAGDAHVTRADLDLLLNLRSYLELESALAADANLSPADRAYFAGVMANRRNRASESIRLLQPLIPELSRSNQRSAVVALSTLADDYEKTFQYAAAADAYADLAKNFAQDMTSGEFRRVKQEAERWNLLREAPPQSASINGPFIVKTSRNRLGLVKAAVIMAGHPITMVLDTGANLSTISRSTAVQLGLKLSRDQATMEGMAADPMPVHAAVIQQLEIGEATFRNVAVIVVEDKDMFVPAMHYMLPGSLGFPVLSALGKITFFSNDRFGVGLQPTPSKFVKGNLFLQRLTPIVSARIRSKEELFTIDTGATGSFLSSRYYGDHPREFASQMVGEIDLTGAGGSRSLPAYYIPEISLSLGGACVRLKDLPVLIKPQGIPDDYYYGNLGQSAVSASKSYTFDFQNMSFTLDGPPCHASSIRDKR